MRAIELSFTGSPVHRLAGYKVVSPNAPVDGRIGDARYATINVSCSV